MAHAEKLKEETLLAWKWCGDYVMSAIYFAVEHNLHGKKAKSEYAKRPSFEEPKEQNTIEGRATIEKMNFELRGKMLEKMGFPMPPR